MEKSETISAVRRLIGDKIELFKAYENATDEMLKCEIDNMLNFIGIRQELAHKIDELDQSLNDIYASDDNESLKEIIFNKIDFGACPENLQPLFLMGQDLLACFSRVSGKEEQIVAYVEQQKEILLDLIKNQNKNFSVNGSKYFGTIKHSDEDYKIFDHKC